MTFRPEIIERLNLEAHTIETVMTEFIDGLVRPLSTQVDRWEPAPCPVDRDQPIIIPKREEPSSCPKL